jgi:hypothetical protein
VKGAQRKCDKHDQNCLRAHLAPSDATKKISSHGDYTMNEKGDECRREGVAQRKI